MKIRLLLTVAGLAMSFALPAFAQDHHASPTVAKAAQLSRPLRRPTCTGPGIFSGLFAPASQASKDVPRDFRAYSKVLRGTRQVRPEHRADSRPRNLFAFLG